MASFSSLARRRPSFIAARLHLRWDHVTAAIAIASVWTAACHNPATPCVDQYGRSDNTPFAIGLTCTAVGANMQCAAKPLYGNYAYCREALPPLTWSSSNASVASVTTGGFVTVLARGEVDIMVTPTSGYLDPQRWSALVDPQQPPQQVYFLSGIIRENDGSDTRIAGGAVEILDGYNAGRSSGLSNEFGAYRIDRVLTQGDVYDSCLQARISSLNDHLPRRRFGRRGGSSLPRFQVVAQHTVSSAHLDRVARVSIGMTHNRIEDMSQPSDAAWCLVREAARTAERAARGERTCLPADGDSVIVWRGAWHCTLPEDDPRRPLLDLYLPFCSATAANPITLAHLGQSLDGFIATHTGESQWVTGHENVVHMHRLRALCDAVIVGPGTVAADDPRLTTRLVEGPNPLRVVLDPDRRLPADHRVFADGCAETLYVCASALVNGADERHGQASVLGVAATNDGIDLANLLRILHERGHHRLFIEGGGVTVSLFLQAGLLDRLHLAIAPFLIGDGRAAIRLPAPAALEECHRPAYRVFRMGGDILFDCNLRSSSEDEPASALTRVI